MPESHSSDLNEDFDDLDRLSQFFQDCSLGTLWWVDENIWINVLKHYGHSDRVEHPGLSVHNSPLPPIAHVPLMHGTSKKISNAFNVSDITPRGPVRVTWFQWKRIGKVSVNLFGGVRCSPAEKQRLSEEEMIRFRSELEKKGLL